MAQKDFLVHVYVTCTVSAKDEEEARKKLKEAKSVYGCAANGDIFIIASLHGEERLDPL